MEFFLEWNDKDYNLYLSKKESVLLYSTLSFIASQHHQNFLAGKLAPEEVQLAKEISNEIKHYIGDESLDELFS